MEWSPENVGDYSPKSHCRYAKGSRELLLWPVRRWQVIMPRSQEQNLNALQRVVLRLFISGQRESVEIAKLLGFEPELITYVVNELTEKKCLADNGMPTETGHGKLDEEATLEPGELRRGWVFQNAVTGKLFPRFVEEVPAANLECDERRNPVIFFGSKGKPYKKRAFIIRRDSDVGKTPSPREILDAASRHQRQVRRNKRAELEVGVESIQTSDISFVSEEPTLMHLLTFIYIPEENKIEDYPWYVAEPFGFGASPELREQLKAHRIGSKGGLRDALDKITGMGREKLQNNHQQMQKLFEEAAEDQLAQLFPLGDRFYDEYVRQEFKSAYISIARFEESKSKKRDLSPAYLHLRKALERSLSLCLTNDRPDDVWKKVYGKEDPLPKNASAKFIESCAMEIGFTDIPNQIKYTNVERIERICTRSNYSASSLSASIATLILSAIDGPKHPFWRLAKNLPDWLEEAVYLIKTAGENVHAGSKSRTLEELKADTKRAGTLIRELLNSMNETNNNQNEIG